MPVVTLLNAVSANTTGTPAWLGVLYGNLTIGVSTTGTVSAFSVALQGSNDGQSWANIGSAVTSTTAGTSIGTGALFQYFRATLSGYSGTGTVTCELACSLTPSSSGGGGPPSGAAGGDLSGSYPNPTVAQLDGQALPVPISIGGTGASSASAALTALGAAPLASPALTGAPTAPTATALTDSTQVATTAYTDLAVGVETGRAETAEALALPKTGGTMSGAIAMGSNKVTGLTNGSGAQDAAAYGQTPAGGNTATVPQGGTGDTSLTAYAPLAGGTTTTGAVQSASTGLSTSGNVFTSTGSSSLPSFQALPAASTSASGIIELSNTAAAAAQAAGAAGTAGTTGKAADGGHSHPASLLATHQYAPGTLAHYTTTSTTVAAMDTTNMTVSFTAPASGNVLISLSAAAASNTSTSNITVWALLDHTSGTIYGNLMFVTTVLTLQLFTARQLITGLTGGSSYQMDWALGASTSSDTVNTYAMGIASKTIPGGSECGPAVMEVWAA